MRQALLVTIHLHDGRYHGSDQWPPAPARVFQALVAASARGSQVAPEALAALEWLEQCSPPIVACPRARKGQKVVNWVPNNDLDSVGGDPGRVAEIRAGKVIQPHLFEREVPFGYAWLFDPVEGNVDKADAICQLTKGLYQFGRGVDMAWAQGELLDEVSLSQRLETYSGSLHYPSKSGGSGLSLAAPAPGSLRSLLERFAAQSRRFTWSGQGEDRQLVLQQAPQPRFSAVTYDAGTSRHLFDLQGIVWSTRNTAELVGQVRDAAAARLSSALPNLEELIQRVLCGRNSQGSADKRERVRILPLPSIGHKHVDMSIRRICIEVPSECPLSSGDIAWAFSGLPLHVKADTGEVSSCLVAADDERMQRHYGFDQKHRIWQTVTAAVLPESTARRRIEPTRQTDEAKAARERIQEESRAIGAVLQSLRHTGVETPVAHIQVRREPFYPQGERAERFAPETRFRKERFWHVRVAFAETVTGPLVLGDGRFLGLGLMAPVLESQGVLGFSITSGLLDGACPEAVAQALRRAVMARAQNLIGAKTPLPAYFSGHKPDGDRLTDDHAHLAFVADLASNRLLIVAPEKLNRALNENASNFALLLQALSGFDDLRAGPAGRLRLQQIGVDEGDPLLTPSKVWESATAYSATRHPKRNAAPEPALIEDALVELGRRGFPSPLKVEVLQARKGPRGGLKGRLRLTFRVAIEGPLMLGKTSHSGGGLFLSN